MAKQEGYENWVKLMHFKKDWSLNRRAADARALEDDAPDQHADLGARAQSLLLRGRYGRKPAALHRPHRDDAGRGYRDPEPARDRRRVRPAGAPHRSRQAAGHHREPEEGQLHRPSRHRASTAPTRRCRSIRASRPIRKSPSGSPTPISAARCRSASTATSSTRRSGWAWARRARRCRARTCRYFPGKEWRTQMVDATIRAKANARCSTRSASRKKDSEGFRVRTDNGERLRIQIQAVKALHALAGAGRDDRPAVAEDRHLGRRRRRWSATSRSRARATTSTTSRSGPTAARRSSICSRATPSRSTPRRASWGRSTPSGTLRAASRAASPTIPTG